MAEQRRNGPGRDGAGRSGSLSPRRAVGSVRKDFPALVGRPIESVSGFARDREDVSERATVQVVELDPTCRSTDGLNNGGVG